MLFSTLSLVVIFLALSLIFTSLSNDISPCPSSFKARQNILQRLLERQWHPQVVYELGSGWGGMARALAKHYPHAQVEGIENSPLPYLFSIFWNALFPLKNLHFRFQNFLNVPLDEAQLLFTYLCPSLMAKVAKKLSSGQVLLSYTFAHPWKKPAYSYRCEDFYQSPVYLYFL